jgi:hypothetical protein
MKLGLRLLVLVFLCVIALLSTVIAEIDFSVTTSDPETTDLVPNETAEETLDSVVQSFAAEVDEPTLRGSQTDSHFPAEYHREKANTVIFIGSMLCLACCLCILINFDLKLCC